MISTSTRYLGQSCYSVEIWEAVVKRIGAASWDPCGIALLGRPLDTWVELVSDLDLKRPNVSLCRLAKLIPYKSPLLVSGGDRITESSSSFTSSHTPKETLTHPLSEGARSVEDPGKQYAVYHIKFAKSLEARGALSDADDHLRRTGEGRGRARHGRGKRLLVSSSSSRAVVQIIARVRTAGTLVLSSYLSPSFGSRTSATNQTSTTHKPPAAAKLQHEAGAQRLPAYRRRLGKPRGRTLAEFLETARADGVTGTYYLQGAGVAGDGVLHAMVVPDHALDAAKKKFRKFTSHVYSVQACEVKDTDALSNVDYEVSMAATLETNHRSGIWLSSMNLDDASRITFRKLGLIRNPTVTFTPRGKAAKSQPQRTVSAPDIAATSTTVDDPVPASKGKVLPRASSSKSFGKKGDAKSKAEAKEAANTFKSFFSKPSVADDRTEAASAADESKPKESEPAAAPPPAKKRNFFEQFAFDKSKLKTASSSSVDPISVDEPESEDTEADKREKKREGAARKQKETRELAEQEEKTRKEAEQEKRREAERKKKEEAERRRKELAARRASPDPDDAVRASQKRALDSMFAADSEEETEPKGQPIVVATPERESKRRRSSESLTTAAPADEETKANPSKEGRTTALNDAADIEMADIEVPETEDYSSWEEYSEDEVAARPPPAKKLKKPEPENAGKGRKADGAGGKKGGGQKTLLSFFGKGPS
ncbi:hypothetical protein BDK51DRAFT_39303 [Blyttiomyces helicus]|uniref:DNA polymerase delta subunit 3 n=1 Tax=Blyttiomyces helicus TaxID=388810 RepID=A0A4P9WAS7_9FUNG|nr:hypothetical protein BDK51DRAFT_39303 [Blyttiomyces helicus]|eukprot:RKO88258.1 hypothetical protein BDK51DRAFT_39303 [Blyttiomyces helicus]